MGFDWRLRWSNYFGIAKGYQRCVDLDHWIRRRVRMAYWQQWRKPRTKVRNLITRGVHVQSAVACGITSTKSRLHEEKGRGVALKPQGSIRDCLSTT
jgi:hypothetical protein